jgi:hypothetical protein
MLNPNQIILRVHCSHSAWRLCSLSLCVCVCVCECVCMCVCMGVCVCVYSTIIMGFRLKQLRKHCFPLSVVLSTLFKNDEMDCSFLTTYLSLGKWFARSFIMTSEMTGLAPSLLAWASRVEYWDILLPNLPLSKTVKYPFPLQELVAVALKIFSLLMIS